MPFLYFPDAISLALILLALSLLRRSASLQFQQEMHRLRADLFVCCADAGFQSSLPACRHLNARIKSAVECAEQISPGRLFFVARLVRKGPPSKYAFLLPEWLPGFESLVQTIPDYRTREKLRRIQMELNTNLGMYYLFGSLSGWIVASGVFYRLIRRAFSRPSKSRIDWIFDLMERRFIREGIRIHRLALMSSNARRNFRLADLRQETSA